MTEKRLGREGGLMHNVAMLLPGAAEKHWLRLIQVSSYGLWTRLTALRLVIRLISCMLHAFLFQLQGYMRDGT